MPPSPHCDDPAPAGLLPRHPMRTLRTLPSHEPTEERNPATAVSEACGCFCGQQKILSHFQPSGLPEIYALFDSKKRAERVIPLVYNRTHQLASGPSWKVRDHPCLRPGNKASPNKRGGPPDHPPPPGPAPSGRGATPPGDPPVSRTSIWVALLGASKNRAHRRSLPSRSLCTTARTPGARSERRTAALSTGRCRTKRRSRRSCPLPRSGGG